MRSAECDGPNGIRSLHGPGLGPPGDRNLATRSPASIRHDGHPVPLLSSAASLSNDAAQEPRLEFPVRAGGSIPEAGYGQARLMRTAESKTLKLSQPVSWSGSDKHKGIVCRPSTPTW